MHAVGRIIEWISDKLKIAGAACLVGMMFLTCADVVGRFFRHPILGSVELVTFMAALSVALALPYTHQVKGHIGVELLVRTLPPKVQVVIDIVTGMLSLALIAIITWRMALYAGTIGRSGEVSMELRLPIEWIIYAVAFCFLIFTLVIFQELIDNINKLKK
jgi:TRAP-type C4-dicarboxylate transport system permease small subunit